MRSKNLCYLQKYVIFAWIHLSLLRYSRTHSGNWMNPGKIWNICMGDGGYLHDLECLYQRVAGLGGDSTLVVLVPGHLDVSILSPFLTPAINQSKSIIANEVHLFTVHKISMPQQWKQKNSSSSTKCKITQIDYLLFQPLF